MKSAFSRRKQLCAFPFSSRPIHSPICTRACHDRSRIGSSQVSLHIIPRATNHLAQAFFYILDTRATPKKSKGTFLIPPITSGSGIKRPNELESHAPPPSLSPSDYVFHVSKFTKSRTIFYISAPFSAFGCANNICFMCRILQKVEPFFYISAPFSTFGCANNSA